VDYARKARNKMKPSEYGVWCVCTQQDETQ
jgi:hypothetical protein